MRKINVPIGPAIVKFGKTNPTVFDITKGGIVLTLETEVHDSTVDQFGNTPVKSVILGRNLQVIVPMAEYDLQKLSVAMPDSDYFTDGDKEKLVVKANSGFDLLSLADQLVIEPTDENATPNDYVTIPLAGPMADIEATYDSENERIYNVTFKAYVDPDNDNQLFILGDTTVVGEVGSGDVEG